MNDHLVSEDDHIALTRLVTELVWRLDHGRAGEVVRTTESWRFVSRRSALTFTR
jgi:hypothetical protein